MIERKFTTETQRRGDCTEKNTLPRNAAKINAYGTLLVMKDFITEKIIGAAIEVHRHLGPGLLESTYEYCLAKEFDLKHIRYERQKMCRVLYKELILEEAYRIDFLIENEVVLEIKSVAEVCTICEAQMLTYLRLLSLRRGLLLNFNVAVLKAGIKCFCRVSRRSIFLFALAKRKVFPL